MAGIEPDTRVFPNRDALNEAAASLFIETAVRAVAERGTFHACLSGGTTPEGLYVLLAQLPYRDQLDWRNVHVFWGDERCVPPEDVNSNYRAAADLLLSHVPIPGENVHRVRTELEPELAAEDYALTLQKYAEAPLTWPRFDLILLGLGLDGHTASLFPGSPPDPSQAVVAVRSKDPARPGWRVSLTPRVLNSGRRVIFLVLGAGKSKVVANVLFGDAKAESLPARWIRPENGELIWMLDAAAAAK